MIRNSLKRIGSNITDSIEDIVKELDRSISGTKNVSISDSDVGELLDKYI
jgi:hypothetical protein